MSQREEWANQRLSLLQKHVQEWKNHTLQEAQARMELVAKHQAEKEHIRPQANALEWAHCLAKYTEHLTSLSIVNQHQQQLM